MKKTMYEPEQFPGLIYRMDEPKVVILIFASGKLVCTGAKKGIRVCTAVKKLQETLETKNLILYEALRNRICYPCQESSLTSSAGPA